MSRRNVAAAIALLVCFLWPPLSTAAGDCESKARDILEKVSKKYRSLERYDVLFEVDAPTKAAAGRPPMQLRLSVEKPDRSRAEIIETPQPGMDLRVLSLSNGDSTWTLFSMRPLLIQYTCEAAASVGPGGPGGGVMGSLGDFFARYVDLPQKAQQPCASGEESVPFMGRSVACDVVEFGERRSFPSALGDSAHVTLWVDKKTSLVMKETAAADSLELHTRLVKGVFEERLPDSLFAFTPPADAQRVSEFAFAGAAKKTEAAGRPASDFTLEDLDGRSVRLSDLRGNVVLLDFWATWCGPCRRELPVIRAIHSEFGEDLTVLAVNVREKPATITSFFSKNGPLGVRVLLDAAGEVSSLYSVSGIPTVIVIGRDGTIAWSHTGVAAEEEIRQAVKQAQADTKQ